MGWKHLRRFLFNFENKTTALRHSCLAILFSQICHLGHPGFLMFLLCKVVLIFLSVSTAFNLIVTTKSLLLSSEKIFKTRYRS